MTDAVHDRLDPGAASGTSNGAQRDPAMLVSLAVAVLVGLALVLTARTSAVALLVTIAVVQAVFAVAWVFGTRMPGRWGGLLIAALAAAGADVAASIWPHGRLGTLLAVLGLAVPVMFVHQLARGAARVRLVSSLAAVAVLVLAEVSLPALLQLRHEFAAAGEGGRVAAAAAGAAAGALVVGYLVDLVLPAPRFDPAVPRGLLALIASGVVGGAVGYLLLRDDVNFVGGRSVFVGAALGALAALLAVAAAFVLYSTPEPVTVIGRQMRPVLAALLPLVVLAPVAFLICLSIRS